MSTEPTSHPDLPVSSEGVGHTPGPWRVGRGGPNLCPTVGTRSGLMVAMVSHGEDHPTQANARLIAAAPDLLAALKGILGLYTELVESGNAGFWDAEKETEVIDARAAISQATRSEPST